MFCLARQDFVGGGVVVAAFSTFPGLEHTVLAVSD